MAKTEQEVAAPQIVGPHGLLDDVTNDPLAGRAYMGYDTVPTIEGEWNHHTKSFGFPQYEKGEFEVEFYHVLGEPAVAVLQLRTAGSSDTAALVIWLDWYDGETGIGSYYVEIGSGWFYLDIPSASFDDANTNDNRVRIKGTWGLPYVDGIWYKYWFPAVESEPSWSATGETTYIYDEAYEWGPDYPPSLTYEYANLWSTTIYPERQPGGFSMINVYSDDTEWKMKDRFTMDAVIWQPSWTTDAVIKKTVIGTTRPIPPEYISSSVANDGWSETFYMDKPVGTQDGDLLVAVIAGTLDGGSYAPASTGWTRWFVSTHEYPYYGLWVFTKTADSEPTDWVWQWSDSHNGNVSYSVHCIRGGEIATYATATGDDYSTTSNTPSFAAPGDSLVLAAFGGNGPDSWNLTTLDVDLAEIANASYYYINHAVGYEDIGSPKTVQYTAEMADEVMPNTAVFSLIGLPQDGFTMDALIVTEGMSIRSFTIDAVIYYYEGGGEG